MGLGVVSTKQKGSTKENNGGVSNCSFLSHSHRRHTHALKRPSHLRLYLPHLSHPSHLHLL